MLNKRKRTQMSHTPWLLVWVLSQCRLKARYSHSSFPPITYIKKERVRATLNFMIIRKPIRALSLVFSNTIERRKPLLSKALQMLVITSTVTWDDLLASCLWSELRGFQSSIDFLFNSQLKSSKNSVLIRSAWQGNYTLHQWGERPCPWPILHPTP